MSLAEVTSVVVSHDSGFLDAVCTDIVHYEKDKKLKHYKVLAAPVRTTFPVAEEFALQVQGRHPLSCMEACCLSADDWGPCCASCVRVW